MALFENSTELKIR